VRKASGFPFATQNARGFASGGVAAIRGTGLPESRRLSAREAAKPHSKPHPKPHPKPQLKAENEQASTHKVAYNLDHDG